MIIEQTTDNKLIHHILSMEGIAETISEPGDAIPTEFSHGSHMFLVGLTDDEVVGLLIVHNTSLGVPQLHIQVVPKHRKEHAIQFGEASLEWLWGNLVNDKYMALIPEIYPNVKRYAEAIGLKKEGFLTNTFRVKQGQWLMAKSRGK